MADLLIRGMEMPKSCWGCALHKPLYHTSYCSVVNKNCSPLKTKKDWCPLVKIPNVGDMAWFIVIKKLVMYGRCEKISIHSGGIQITMSDTDGEPWNVSYKRVFYTREEAEAALRGEADTIIPASKEGEA